MDDLPRQLTDGPRGHLTPGRARRTRPGVVLCGLLLSLATACEEPPVLQRAELELEDRTVLLERGARIWDVRVGGSGATSRIEPDSIEARPGDVVRFIAADGLTHAVAFDDAALTVEQRAFLDTTGQLRGPPLLDPGATWVVSLEDAPPGVYTFVSMTREGRGKLTVVAPD